MFGSFFYRISVSCFQEINFQGRGKNFRAGEQVRIEAVETQRKEEKVSSKQEMKWLRTDFPIYVKNLSSKRKLAVLLLEAVEEVQVEAEGAVAEVEVFLQERAVQAGAEVVEAAGAVEEEEDGDKIFIFFKFSRFFMNFKSLYYKRCCVEILIFFFLIYFYLLEWRKKCGMQNYCSYTEMISRHKKKPKLFH